MIYRFSLVLLGVLAFTTCDAQRYIGIMDQLFTVHSAGNVFVNTNSNSRNIIQVNFPVKTKGYIYRITTGSGNSAGQPEKLYQLLKSMVPPQVAMEASLAQFVINSTDSKAIDAYIFSNVYDSNNFLQKREGNWTACQQNSGVLSTCLASDQCISPTIYFGFRNNNLANPINVHLEVVAIVDTTSQIDFSYSYTVANGTTQAINYQISNDQTNWESYTVAQGYANTLKRDQQVIYIRLITTALNMVTYEIHPEQRYRIIWSNAGRWDLVTY